MRKFIYIVLPLLLFNILSVSSPTYTLKGSGFSKELKYSKFSIVVEPIGNLSSVSLSDEHVYFWISLEDVYISLNITIIVLDPNNKTFLIKNIFLVSPNNLNITKFNWVFVSLRLPIRVEGMGVLELRAFPRHIKNLTFPVNGFNETGQWTFKLFINGKIVDKKFLFVRPLRLKLHVVKLDRTPLEEFIIKLENTKILIVNGSNGKISVDVYPGFYLLKVFWKNFTVYSSFLSISEDKEVTVVCNVSFISLRVIGKNNKSLENATIELISQGFPFRLVAKTNNDGRITISNIPHSQYYVTIYWKGINVFSGFLITNKSYTIKVDVYDLYLKVVGEQGQPLKDVIVNIPSLNLTGITDNEGKVKFSNIPKGEWIAVLTYKGQRKTVILKVPGENKVCLKVFVEIAGVVLSKEAFVIIITGAVASIILSLILLIVYTRVYKR